MAGHAGARAGIVDQNIHPSEMPITGLDQGIDIVPAAAMGGKGERLPAHLAHFLGGGFARIQLAAGNDHIGAIFREGLDHLIAKAAAAAGYECHFAGQVEQVARHLCSSNF